MGAGTAIAGIGSGVGIALIIVGALISLTGIGALIGIPLIIIGIMAIAGSAAGGATVGAARATYKVSKDIAKASKRRNIKGSYCIECGGMISKRAKFCPECGEEQ